MGDKQGHLQGLLIENIRAFKRYTQSFLDNQGKTEMKKKPTKYKNREAIRCKHSKFGGERCGQC
jgi:hypothetical protein